MDFADKAEMYLLQDWYIAESSKVPLDLLPWNLASADAPILLTPLPPVRIHFPATCYTSLPVSISLEVSRQLSLSFCFTQLLKIKISMQGLHCFWWN